MSRVTITRRFWFSYGHRVYLHESECANIHGHNARLLVTVTGPKLDDQGRVVDFKELKRRVDPWLQSHWDHAFLWNEKDPVGKFLYGEHREFESMHVRSPILDEISQMKNYKCPFNPTAEEMSIYLAEKIIPALLGGTNLTVVKVTLYETDNCSATVEAA